MTSNYNKFTFLEYKNILTHIKSIYNFKLVSDKLSKIDKKICVLRHDVDMSPENALEMAKLKKYWN